MIFAHSKFLGSTGFSPALALALTITLPFVFAGIGVGLTHVCALSNGLSSKTKRKLLTFVWAIFRRLVPLPSEPVELDVELLPLPPIWSASSLASCPPEEIPLLRFRNLRLFLADFLDGLFSRS